jgi:hypothetical protein
VKSAVAQIVAATMRTNMPTGRRRVYLSVDLDYFNQFSDNFLLQSLRYFKNLNADTKIVESHERLVPHTKKFDFDILVNIDAHSDYCAWELDDGETQISTPGNCTGNCGDWVDHAYRDGMSEYVWVLPSASSEFLGRCDAGVGEEEPPFHKVGGVWPVKRKTKGWKTILRGKEVVALGIATSYIDKYTDNHVIETIFNNLEMSDWFEKGIGTPTFLKIRSAYVHRSPG